MNSFNLNLLKNVYKSFITLFLIVICTCSSIVNADYKFSSNEDTKVSLRAMFEFQAGLRNQTNLAKVDQNISGVNNLIAFYSEALFLFIGERKVNDVNYGMYLGLLTTTISNRSAMNNGSNLFIEWDKGKVELGSPFDAGTKMRITGGEVAVATGGDWSRYTTLDGERMSYKGEKVEFALGTAYFTDTYYLTDLNEDRIRGRTEPARKVNYFTPEFNGLRFGVSFIPDSSNNGTANPNVVATGREIDFVNGYVAEVNKNVKNAFTLGLSYEHTFDNDLSFKGAITSELGNPAAKMQVAKFKEGAMAKYKESEIKELKQIDANDLEAAQSFALTPMRTLNIGAVVKYGSFSLAASYGTLGNSLTNAVWWKNGRDTSYVEGGVAYAQGPASVSFTYFGSSQSKNIVRAYILGTQYKIAPGLLPYLEYTYFTAYGRPIQYPDSPLLKSSGSVFILGVRLGL